MTSPAIHPTVKPGDLSQFFWKHLRRDLHILSKTTGCNIDDAALLIHLILQKMCDSKFSG